MELRIECIFIVNNSFYLFKKYIDSNVAYPYEVLLLSLVHNFSRLIVVDLLNVEDECSEKEAVPSATLFIAFV